MESSSTDEDNSRKEKQPRTSKRNPCLKGETSMEANCNDQEPSDRPDVHPRPMRYKTSARKRKKCENVPEPCEDFESKSSYGFRTRMSPHSFIRFIPKLNDHQRTAIHELGFSAFLHIGMSRIPSQLSKWLLEKFDPYTMHLAMVNGTQLRIEPLDVYLCLGLPQGERDITKALEGENTTEYLLAVEEWRSGFGISQGAPPISHLLDRMLQCVDGGVEFKRNFIMYVYSTFLCGNQQRFANPKVMKLMIDSPGVLDYDWCSFVTRTLSDSAEHWLANRDSYFTGPLYFLVVFYLDRVVFKYRTVKRRWPLIMDWTQDVVTRRVRHEQNVGFGRGFVDNRYLADVPKVVNSRSKNLEVQNLEVKELKREDMKVEES